MEAWRLCRGTDAKRYYTVYIEQDAGRNDSGADQDPPGQIGYTKAIQKLYKAVGIVPLPFLDCIQSGLLRMVYSDII